LFARKKERLLMGDTIVRDRPLSPYARMILEATEQYGGFKNAHAHLDRADTLDGKYLANVNLNPIEAASMSLKEKQHLTGYLHQGPDSGRTRYKKAFSLFKFNKELLPGAGTDNNGGTDFNGISIHANKELEV